MLRLTKGGTQTCTVFYNDGTTFSWYWGCRGLTSVSDAVKKMGEMIQSCIENDLDIPLDGFPEYLNESLKIQSKEDAKHAVHSINVVGETKNCICKKDGYFFAPPVAGAENVISFFEQFGYSVQGDIVETETLDGRPVKTFKIAR